MAIPMGKKAGKIGRGGKGLRLIGDMKAEKVGGKKGKARKSY
jgi:hypothetical protein